MANLEINIGGSDKGGNSELRETIGLIERLQDMKSGLEIDLIKAETVADIRRVGEQLTGVNVRIGEYIGLASKATTAWKDNQTELILDNLASKIALTQANAAAFGNTVQTQNAELKAYEAAFNQLVSNGLDPAGKELTDIAGKINVLTGAIQSQKGALAEQKALDQLSVKLKQLGADVLLSADAQKKAQAEIRAYQTGINNLIKAGVDPADSRIKGFQSSIEALNATISQSNANKITGEFQQTGSIVNDLNGRIAQLRQQINFATSEQSIASLNSELANAQAELKRLAVVGLTAEQQMKRFGSNSSAFGTELARIVQDAPYATTALGAIQNNFGAIGNNITRATELFPQFTRNVREAVEAKRAAGIQANVLSESFRGLLGGMGGLIFAVSILTSAIQVYTALSQKKQRELEKEAKATKTLADATNELIEKLDAQSRLTAQTISNYAKEITTLTTLYGTIRSANTSRQQQIQALEELQKLYPDIYANLSIEEIQVGKNAAAYEGLADSIRKVAYAEAARNLGAQALENELKASVALEALNRKIAKEKERVAVIDARAAKAAERSSYGAVGAARQGNAINENIELLQKQAAEQEKAQKTAKADADAFFDAATRSNGQVREQTGLIYDLEKQLKKVQAQRPFLKTEADLKANTEEAHRLQKELERLGGGSRIKILGGLKDESDKAKKSLRELGTIITGIYDAATDSGNLIGLDGVDRDIQTLVNKYGKLTDKVNEEEAKQVAFYREQIKQKPKFAAEAEKQITQVVKDAAAERAEIDEGLARDLNATIIKFNEDRAARIAELEGRAGISRIKSREQELAANKLYWDGVARNAEKYGITLEQLAEYRKSSEFQINQKWDQKMIESSFIYRRRQNETFTQMLIRRLNKETELELKAAQGNADKKSAIQARYFSQLNSLQAGQREQDFLFNLREIDNFEIKLGELNTQLQLLRDKRSFQLISNEEYAKGAAAIAMQVQQVQLLGQAFDATAAGIGDSFVGAIFEGENALESLATTFKNVAKNIISGLIQVATRYAINQALGVSSMAATAAASAAAGAKVAAAWSTAATFASVASFGAAAAVGAGALASAVAASKALSLTGFATGGYTGNISRREIAGVVHGQEFVVNAMATRDNLPLLKAMNAGKDVSAALPSRARSINFGQIGGEQQAQTIRIQGDLSNTSIKLSNDRATRFNRKFGRG